MVNFLFKYLKNRLLIAEKKLKLIFLLNLQVGESTSYSKKFSLQQKFSFITKIAKLYGKLY